MLIFNVFNADCPRNVRVIGLYDDPKVNSKLSCGSDAYPPARYQWKIVRGSGSVDGQYFVVDSPGFFNVSCTASNFLRPPDNEECIGATVYVTGCLPASQSQCMFVSALQ